MKKIFLLLLFLMIPFVSGFQFTELNKGIDHQICVSNHVISQIKNSDCNNVLNEIVSEFTELSYIKNGSIQLYEDVFETAKNLSYQFRETLKLYNISNIQLNDSSCQTYDLKLDLINYAFPKGFSTMLQDNGKDIYRALFGYVSLHGVFSIKPIPKGGVITNVVSQSLDLIKLKKLELEGKVISLRQLIAKKLKQ